MKFSGYCFFYIFKTAFVPLSRFTLLKIKVNLKWKMQHLFLRINQNFPNPQGTADWVTFTEEIRNGKLHLLCSDIAPK